MVIKSGSLCKRLFFGLPSPPYVSVLEHEEHFIGCEFSLGDNSLFWLGLGAGSWHTFSRSTGEMVTAVPAVFGCSFCLQTSPASSELFLQLQPPCLNFPSYKTKA